MGTNTDKTDWKQARKDRNRENLKRFDNLMPDQQAAIKKTFKALEAAQQTLTECNDLWLSDIKKLDSAFWQMRCCFKSVVAPEDDDG
jgi:hypothetical protein